MKVREGLIHLLGAFLAVSIIYLSVSTSLVLIPISALALVSIAVWRGISTLKYTSIIAVTLSFPFFFQRFRMSDLEGLVFYSIVFLLPLVLYWALVLFPPEILHVNKKALMVSVSYVGTSLALFYALLFAFQVQDFILREEYPGPQALVLLASTLIMTVVYRLGIGWLNQRRKD